MARRWRDPQSASDLGRLDPEAIDKVRSEAWPDPVNAEELHDALLWLGCLTQTEAEATPAWGEWLEALMREKRVARLKAPHATLIVPAERLKQFRALWPEAGLEPEIAPPPDQAGNDVAARAGAHRDPARPAGGSRARHADCAHAAPLGLEPAAGGERARGARKRGRSLTRTLPSRRQ